MPIDEAARNPARSRILGMALVPMTLILLGILCVNIPWGDFQHTAPAAVTASPNISSELRNDARNTYYDDAAHAAGAEDGTEFEAAYVGSLNFDGGAGPGIRVTPSHHLPHVWHMYRSVVTKP